MGSKSEGQMNMRGVYLHILGDALGSVIVIIASLIVHFVKHKWTSYVDPVLSIVMVAIILNSSVPLLKESSKILLQNVPSHIQMKQLEDRLLNAFPEIIGIHEFHVWQLAGNKIIASVHVKFTSNAEYDRVSPNLKEFFHYEGIHSTTFQPEFVEEEGEEKKCLLACNKSCQEKLCCIPSPAVEKRKISDDQAAPLTNGHAVSIENIDVEHPHCHDNVSIHIENTSEAPSVEEESCCPESDNNCTETDIPRCCSESQKSVCYDHVTDNAIARWCPEADNSVCYDDCTEAIVTSSCPEPNISLCYDNCAENAISSEI